MGVTERVWAVIKDHQQKIEDLTGRMIKMETTIELLMSARGQKRIG